MSMSIDIELPQQVALSTTASTSSTQQEVEVCRASDMIVSGLKREYAIVGDGLFASVDIGTAPQWLLSIIDQTVGNSLNNSMQDVVAAHSDLIAAIDAIEVANNNYAEIINIDATVDSAVSSHLATLNARIDVANSSIINLDTTKVSAEEAVGLSVDAITASLSADGVGTIGGSILAVSSSVNTLAGSVTSNRTLIESRYGELNTALAGLTIQVETGLTDVSTMLSYDSVIKIGDDYYKSGFGLNTAYRTEVPGSPGTYLSEFWIDATRFKFTNSLATGAVAPFTIDASGPTPQIQFNGVVSFTNVTDVPALGSTPDEVVEAINNGDTTVINGGRIDTSVIGTGVIYNTGANESNYKMKIDLNAGGIYIK